MDGAARTAVVDYSTRLDRTFRLLLLAPPPLTPTLALSLAALPSSTRNIRNIRNIGTLFAEGVGCGDSSDPPQHVSAGQGQGQEASEPVSVPSFLVERCASLLQVLY